MKLKKQSTRLEQLLQIAKSPVWDGDLISKTETKNLLRKQYIFHQHGFNCIAQEGIKILVELGFMVP